MKYLQDYISEEQSALLKKHGGFFAFGDSQVKEQAEDGVHYVALGAGLVCPKENAKALADGLDKIYYNGIKKDKAEHTKEQIINREHWNYERNIESTADALKDYGITFDDVLKIHRNKNYKFNATGFKQS